MRGYINPTEQSKTIICRGRSASMDLARNGEDGRWRTIHGQYTRQMDGSAQYTGTVSRQ